MLPAAISIPSHQRLASISPSVHDWRAQGQRSGSGRPGSQADNHHAPVIARLLGKLALYETGATSGAFLTLECPGQGTRESLPLSLLAWESLPPVSKPPEARCKRRRGHTVIADKCITSAIPATAPAFSRAPTRHRAAADQGPPLGGRPQAARGEEPLDLGCTEPDRVAPASVREPERA